MASYFIRKKVLADLNNIKACVYCSSIDELQVEHIYPQKKGGGSEAENLTKACGRCNRLKSDFTLSEFFYRIIKKRDDVFGQCLADIYRLRKHRKSRTSPAFQLKLIDRIRAARELHSYYTRIIDSITKEKYFIRG